MVRILAGLCVLLSASCAAPALAQTTFSPTDLDSNRDGRVVLTRPRDGFRAKDVLVRCPAAPAYTYAITCPVPGIAPPRITTPIEPGKATAKASRRSDLHIGRVLDGYVLDGTGAIQDVRIDLARYGVTMRRKDGSYGTVTGLTIRRVDIRAGEAPIAIRGGSSDIMIEDARLTCTGTSGGIPAGIKIGAAGSPANHHITIRRAIITGCEGMQGTYRQGDGIAPERPDHDITIVDTVSTDHGDGCVDLKSSATRIDNLTVARCNYGLRLWAQGTAGTIHVGEVRKAAIQIKPSTDWTIERMFLPAVVPPGGDIVADGKGGRLVVGWCSRAVVTRAAGLVLGPTCSVAAIP